MKGIRMQSLRNFEAFVACLARIGCIFCAFFGLLIGAVTISSASRTAEAVQNACFERSGELLLIALLLFFTAKIFHREDRWVL